MKTNPYPSHSTRGTLIDFGSFAQAIGSNCGSNLALVAGLRLSQILSSLQQHWAALSALTLTALLLHCSPSSTMAVNDGAPPRSESNGDAGNETADQRDRSRSRTRTTSASGQDVGSSVKAAPAPHSPFRSGCRVAVEDRDWHCGDRHCTRCNVPSAGPASGASAAAGPASGASAASGTPTMSPTLRVPPQGPTPDREMPGSDGASSLAMVGPVAAPAAPALPMVPAALLAPPAAPAMPIAPGPACPKAVAAVPAMPKAIVMPPMNQFVPPPSVWHVPAMIAKDANNKARITAARVGRPYRFCPKTITSKEVKTRGRSVHRTEGTQRTAGSWMGPSSDYLSVEWTATNMSKWRATRAKGPGIHCIEIETTRKTTYHYNMATLRHALNPGLAPPPRAVCRALPPLRHDESGDSDSDSDDSDDDDDSPSPSARPAPLGDKNNGNDPDKSGDGSGALAA